ncbi:MAG: N-6 DNA methylase [Deltaproteobacteria bacterium]|jgi:hypothetical protein|nr:N-6 DNA methylase [Deltaproteobacteria bacterium]
MKLSWDQIYDNASSFSNRWENGQKEKSQSQLFVSDLLKVFGVDIKSDIQEKDGGFEFPVKISEHNAGLIDFFWKKNIAIEMKSKGKNLTEAFKQLQNYMRHLPEDEIPDLFLVSDFENMMLFQRSIGKIRKFKTTNLRNNVNYFANIAGYEQGFYREDLEEVNVKAAEMMAHLHDNLESHGYKGHDLEVYLVRLLFCFFAEHTEIFYKDSFYRYLKNSKQDGSDLAARLGELFQYFNLSIDERENQTLWPDDIKHFRYINGNLFKEKIQLFKLSKDMYNLLLRCAEFDWSKISPAIFGAMFQGVMDKEKRRELGAHYTSEENILKLINSLFMNDLWKEYELIKNDKRELEKFINIIGQMIFLDPACGCGNFLIVTYRELRRLELQAVKLKYAQGHLPFLNTTISLNVNLDQFYGIECEDFACQIAQVGMWLMDHQMNLEAAKELGGYHYNLPLKNSASIINANALKLNWENILPAKDFTYIFGNPPFAGSKMLTNIQREDMALVFNDHVKNYGILDYVTAWYDKASKYIEKKTTKVAFVSTNSITQGEQVTALWKPLIERYGVHIDFAYRTFKWTNEAKGNAGVYCVIIGFSTAKSKGNKIIYDNDKKIIANNINPYLLDAPDIFIEKRRVPLCAVPEIGIGNKPIDGGYYLFTEEEKNRFVKTEPKSNKWFKRWYGAEEFLNNRPRWCLWLGECPPEELSKMPEAKKRIAAVREFRLASKSEPTQKLASTPRLFHVMNMPRKPYLVIPKVTTDRRDYLPIDFMLQEDLASDLLFIIQGANFYHFGVLSSKIHMLWVTAVCGRLGNNLRYSKDIAYNNFPWPVVSDNQRDDIVKAAENIINVRKLYKNSSLASLYDRDTMPDDLWNAHQQLDRTLMRAYRFDIKNFTDAEITGRLINMYVKMIFNK